VEHITRLARSLAQAIHLCSLSHNTTKPAFCRTSAPCPGRTTAARSVSTSVGFAFEVQALLDMQEVMARDLDAVRHQRARNASTITVFVDGRKLLRGLLVHRDHHRRNG